MSPETYNAEQVIAESIQEAQKEEADALNADSIMNKALGKLKKPADDDTAGQESFRRAQETIKAAKARFEKAVADITLRSELTARLTGVNPEDFRSARKELEQIKKDNGKLPPEMQLGTGAGDEFMTKSEAVNKNAESYYENRKSANWEADGKISETLTVETTNTRQVMADVAEMQSAIAEGFPGLDPSKIQEYTTAYNTKIDLGMQWLQANKDAVAGAGTDEDPQRDVMNSGEREALDRLDFARKNLAGAEKGSQHEAGAKEYMNMVSAEQDARRVWNSFPEINPDIKAEFEASSIRQEADASVMDPAVIGFYNEAVRTFKEALSKSGRTAKPTYKEAADLFNKAGGLFKQAVDAYRGVVEGKKAEEEKGELEVAKKAATEASDKMWANWNRDFGPLPEAAKEYARSLGLRSEQEGDKLYKNENATKEDYEKAATWYEDADTKYSTALSRYKELLKQGPNAISAAFAQVQGDTAIMTEENIANTVSNYLSNPALWDNNPLLGAIFKTMVFNGSFDGIAPAMSFGRITREPMKYNVYASFDGGDRANVKLVRVGDDKGALGTLDPEHPEKMARHEVQDKVKLEQELRDRVEAAIRFHNKNGFDPGDVDETVQDFLADTLRRYTPAERALVNGFKYEDVSSPDGRKAIALNEDGEVEVDDYEAPTKTA